METLKYKEKQLVRNDNNDDTYVIKNHFLSEDVKEAILEFKNKINNYDNVTVFNEMDKEYMLDIFDEIFGDFNK